MYKDTSQRKLHFFPKKGTEGEDVIIPVCLCVHVFARVCMMPVHRHPEHLFTSDGNVSKYHAVLSKPQLEFKYWYQVHK